MPVNALADTGALSCVISELVWTDMECDNQQLSLSSLILGATNNTSISTLGEATVRITLVASPAHSTTTTVCAVTQEEMFLSKDVLMELGIVHGL